MYQYRPRQPWNKIKVGTIITTVGSILAVFEGLFIYFTPAQLFLDAFAELGLSLDAGTLGALRESAIWMTLGGCISFIASLFASSNHRVAGAVAIVGSIVGGINPIVIVGGIFLIIGNQPLGSQRIRGGMVPIPMQGGEMNPLDLKRCPRCGALMPLDAKFCPNCGQSPDG